MANALKFEKTRERPHLSVQAAKLSSRAWEKSQAAKHKL